MIRLKQKPVVQEEVIPQEVVKKRPNYYTLYTEDMPRMFHELALLMLTEEQMARVVGVSMDAVADWKVKYPEFLEALQSGKTPTDGKVAKTLLRCCLGYVEEEECTHVSYRGVVKKYTRKVYHAPNGFLCLQWLGVRQRENGWANIQKSEITNNINIKQLDSSDMNESELAMLEKMGISALKKQIAKNAGSN